jgi:NTE family protein
VILIMTTALVLSGGGIKGLIHIGVLDYIKEKKIKIDLVVGASMGAIIGACYALYEDIEPVSKLLDNPDLKSILKFITFNKFSKSLLRLETIEENLVSILGDKQFSDCKIPLIINATNLRTGKEEVFTSGRIIDAIKASISLPGFFEPVKIGNEFYVDGGCVDILPHTIARMHNADRMIASLVTRNPEGDHIDQGFLLEILKVQHYLKSHPQSRLTKYADKMKTLDNTHIMKNLIETIYCTASQSIDDLRKSQNKSIILLTPNTNDYVWYKLDKLKTLVHRGYDEAEKKIPQDF